MQRIGLSRGCLCTLLTASILVNLAGVTLAGWMLQRRGGIQYIRAKLGPKAVHTSYFNRRNGLFVLMPDSPDDVYFVGDSIVQAAEVGEGIPGEYRGQLPIIEQGKSRGQVSN